MLRTGGDHSYSWVTKHIKSVADTCAPSASIADERALKASVAHVHAQRAPFADARVKRTGGEHAHTQHAHGLRALHQLAVDETARAYFQHGGSARDQCAGGGGGCGQITRDGRAGTQRANVSSNSCLRCLPQPLGEDNFN